MTEFTRFNQGVEAPPPNRDTAIQVVGEDFRRQRSASPRADGAIVALCNAQAEGYGLVCGAVETFVDIQPEYARESHARPSRSDGRFSNGQLHFSDRALGAVLGIWLKIFGIGGCKLRWIASLP